MGGMQVLEWAVRHPDRVKRMFLMNTLFGYGGATPPEEKTPWFQWIEKHEEAGTLRGILGELGSTIVSVMKILGFHNSAAIDDAWIRAYTAPFPDRDSCIGGIEFPLDVHYGRFQEYVIEGLGTGNLDAVKAKPAALVYGMQDRAISPEWAMADFRLLFPGAPVVELPNAGHFCQEDEPGTLVAMIQQFIQANP